MTVLTDFLATHQLLTILIVLASGALLGQIKFGPLRFWCRWSPVYGAGRRGP